MGINGKKKKSTGWEELGEDKMRFFSQSDVEYNIPESRKPIVISRDKLTKQAKPKTKGGTKKSAAAKADAPEIKAAPKKPAAKKAQTKSSPKKAEEKKPTSKTAAKKAEAKSVKPADKKAETKAATAKTASKAAAKTADKKAEVKAIAKTSAKATAKTAAKKAEAKTAAKTVVKKNDIKKAKSDTKSKAVVDEIIELPSDAETVTEGKATRNGTFDIKRAKDGRYVFNLYSANKVIIATSQVYSSSQSAMTGVKSVMANAIKAEMDDTTLKKPVEKTFPKWEIYIDRAGEYRFRLMASNGSCICHAKAGYSTKSNCKRGIESIIRLAQDANIDKSYL